MVLSGRKIAGLIPNEIDKKINQAKTPEDAEFWADILDKIMQHNQKKTINEKFKI